MTSDGYAPVIQVRGLHKSFAGTPPVTAIRDCDLDVARGELVGVVGPSGSGKSTLLNLIGLLDRPSSGSYVLDGKETTTMSSAYRTRVRAETIGFVFQSFELMSRRTVLENVMLAGLYLGASARERRARSSEALERVGLADRMDSSPRTMSGGERQRVAIARGIASNPALLLCDEPTGNLDTASSASVMQQLRDLNEEDVTILVITHDLGVASFCDRRVEIRDGILTELVTP